MRKLTLIAAAASALLTGAAAAGAADAQSLYVAPAPTINAAVYVPDGQPLLQSVQFFWGGRNYCWYDDAWNGPGYYWCGYAYRRGFGWGGGFGWHGWRGGGGGHYHGAAYSVHRSGGFHGGGGHSFHGGGGHSGGGHGGGGHGGGDHHH